MNMLEVTVAVEMALVFILLLVLLIVVLIRNRQSYEQGDYGRQRTYHYPVSPTMPDPAFRTVPYADARGRYDQMSFDSTLRGMPVSGRRNYPYYAPGNDSYGGGAPSGNSPEVYQRDYLQYGNQGNRGAHLGNSSEQNGSYDYGWNAFRGGAYADRRPDYSYSEYRNQRDDEWDPYGDAYRRMVYSSPVVGQEKTFHKGSRDSRKNSKNDYSERLNPAPGFSDQEAGRKKKRETDHPRWRVDFMEMSSGRHVVRDFQDRLVVGRQMPKEMESGKLYLSMDATVSRAQFCLFVTKEGIMIENLSKVNVTRKNGYPLWRPVRLDEGDILELGRMRYMVREIRPAS